MAPEDFNPTQVNNFLRLLFNLLNSKEELLALDYPDWNSIYNIAKFHNLHPYALEAMADYSDFLSSSLYSRYLIETAVVVSHQESRTDAFLSLYCSFVQRGLSPIVIKGVVCRELYGAYRNHRPSSDEDIIIKPEEFSAIRQVLEEQGFIMQTKNEHEGSASLEYVQAIPFYHCDWDLYVEVHINPFGTFNAINEAMNRFFTNVFDRVIPVEIDKTKIYTLSFTDHMLFLILHAFKHFIFSGFGIRMVLDILLFASKYDNDINWEYVETCLMSINASCFFNDIKLIGNQYLGFDFKAIHESDNIEDFLHDIMTSGVFGNGTDYRLVAALFTRASLKETNKKNKLFLMLKILFPGKQWLYSVNPKAKSNPILAIPTYYHRMIKGAKYYFMNKKNNRKGAQVGMERMKLLQHYGVI